MLAHEFSGWLASILSLVAVGGWFSPPRFQLPNVRLVVGRLVDEAEHVEIVEARLAALDGQVELVQVELAQVGLVQVGLVQVGLEFVERVRALRGAIVLGAVVRDAMNKIEFIGHVTRYFVDFVWCLLT